MVPAALLVLSLFLPSQASEVSGWPRPSTATNRAPRLTILFFTATWCEPCRAVAPILEKHVRAHPKRAKLVYVDFDRAKEEASYWNVREIPVVIVISRQGKVVLRCEGADSRTLSLLERRLEDLLKSSRERE